MKPKQVFGQASWELTSSTVKAYLTVRGGHIGPVTFDVGGRKVSPLSVAPWVEEKLALGTPDIIKVLRGDFFCMPFGGNNKTYKGEKHPVHGETANETWRLESLGREEGLTMLHASMTTKVRKGRVDKHIILKDGHSVVYQKHILSGYSGKMNPGHHAMLKFPDEPGSGLISTSTLRHRQVWLEPTEQPENRGYSALKAGAVFKSLEKVPTVWGTDTDLSRYPARRGFEDIVILVNDAQENFAWVSVVFPKERFAFFTLKDPTVLASTLFWISNGGRHYAPWNGRHVNVMGLEDLTSSFHTGLAESAAANALNKIGVPTHLNLSPKRATVINYIFGVAALPAGFDHVASITPDEEGVTLKSRNGKTARAAVDVSFLYSGE